MIRVKLTIEKGPSVGKECVVSPGQTVIVGRVDQAGWILRDDSMLSNQHFALEWDGDRCLLRDLQRKFGTKLNGNPVREAIALKDGDLVNAGQTFFRGEVSGVGESKIQAWSVASIPGTVRPLPTPMVTRPNQPPPVENVLAFLRSQPEPLFAMLDAARERPVVYDFILKCGLENQSLYEGTQGDVLAPFAPYLVSLPKTSDLLASLVNNGWGKSWGIVLTSTQSFKEVRRHFRHFLEVELPDKKRAYFRFYDPRVLRVYLPTCTLEEKKKFFGPVSHFFLEGKEPGQIMQFALEENQ